jgi:hypothetical protein
MQDLAGLAVWENDESTLVDVANGGQNTGSMLETPDQE